MTGQSRGLQEILADRLGVTQEIAAANVEHLRLSQIAGGMMVMDMKAERDGTDDATSDARRAENFAALERCMDRINDMEARLSSLDAELDAATKREG